MKTETYRGFEIKADQYCNSGNSWYWEVVGHYSTLQNDDKMWLTEDAAIKSAKQEIDEFLNGIRKRIGI